MIVKGVITQDEKNISVILKRDYVMSTRIGFCGNKRR